LVKNTKYRDLREDFQPVVFVPLSQGVLKSAGSRVMIRSSIGPGVLVSSVRNKLAEISPAIHCTFHIFDTWIQDSLLRERLMALLSGLFGVLAIILTAVGLYGVIWYMVTLRTNEIGIRIALGADRRSVVALILREAAIVLGMGLAVGIGLVFVVGRAAAALLFGLQPHDPLTIVIAALMLLVVTTVASALPAWRASSVNPVIALRQN
jgi:putative ABC transport system permease protein